LGNAGGNRLQRSAQAQRVPNPRLHDARWPFLPVPVTGSGLILVCCGDQHFCLLRLPLYQGLATVAG
jgi:hypothetical protein